MRRLVMRIVHACNFSFNNDGQAFGNPDQKLQHGFIENGHYCYAFPCNDISRQKSWSNSKKGGATRMNEALLKTCQKIQPDLLVLGHAQLVTLETLEKIKESLPEIKMIQWFVDPLEHLHIYQFILDRLPILNAVFLTTGGTLLEQFHTPTCVAQFFPNPVHPELERYKAFESKTFQYDLIFVGCDRKDPVRRALLTELNSALSSQFKLGIFGSLGKPRIHGKERDLLFQTSKASLNLTRHAPMKWYSSDRISQLMGNGLLTCTRAEADLDEIYGSDALLSYTNTPELIEKLQDALSTEKWKTIAMNGWLKNHQEYNTQAVTAKMLNAVNL